MIRSLRFNDLVVFQPRDEECVDAINKHIQAVGLSVASATVGESCLLPLIHLITALRGPGLNLLFHVQDGEFYFGSLD